MPTQALSPADPRNYLGFAKQAAKGTAVAPTYFAAFVDQIGFSHNPNLRDIREAGGGQTISRQVKDFLAPSISFATPARPDIAAALFAYFLGSAGVPTGAGPYTHTLEPAPGAVWLTFERSIADDVIERIVDAMIAELTFDLRKRDSGPEAMISATVQGVKETFEAAATAESYEADRPFLRSDGLAPGGWTIDGANPANVESATLSFAWRMDEAILADAVTRSSLVKLHLECQIETVQLFETTAEGDAYRSTHYGSPTGTEPGEVVFAGNFTTALEYGAGAGQRRLQIAIPVVNWGEAELTEPDPDANEAIRLTRRGVMVANPGADPVVVTAINGQSADYLA